MYREARSLLSDRTLVLNRSWMAITTTTVRRALTLVYSDAAHVVCPETYETHDFQSWLHHEPGEGAPVIRTVRYPLPVPEIIALRTYDGIPRRRVAFSRRNLYRRDNYTCHYCGRRFGASELTIDHVVPRSQGGRTSWDNCVLACEDCNKRKGDRTIREAGMRLLRPPVVPQWSWDVELSRGRARDSWLRFLPRRRAGPRVIRRALG